MSYNPEIHHRRSIRLKGYDYSQAGLYFVTICVRVGVYCIRPNNNGIRPHIFGDIVDGKMILNEYGKIAENEWLKTLELRKNVQLHQFVVMPNHFHAIIEITENDEIFTVGAYCIRPDENIRPNEQRNENDNMGVCGENMGEKNNMGVCNTPLRSPSQTVGAVVRGYKSAVSRHLGFSVWQRNYYEQIIRDRNAHARIAEYIENNPMKWEMDCFYKE